MINSQVPDLWASLHENFIKQNVIFFHQIIPLETFKAQSWDGSFVSVVVGGDGIPLTFSNRNQYADQALEFRRHEMDRQVEQYLGFIE